MTQNVTACMRAPTHTHCQDVSCVCLRAEKMRHGAHVYSVQPKHRCASCRCTQTPILSHVRWKLRQHAQVYAVNLSCQQYHIQVHNFGCVGARLAWCHCRTERVIDVHVSVHLLGLHTQLQPVDFTYRAHSWHNGLMTCVVLVSSCTKHRTHRIQKVP